MTNALHVGMLLYPGLTQLDLTGPYEVLARIPGAQLHTVWKTLDPVRADSGLAFLPSTRMDTCPPLDVVFVPGGRGQLELMQDEEILAFLRAHGERARWVTSVCTGALLLGAAGLLAGHRATTHWLYTELLPAYGAIPVSERVVVDRNRITGGGVTAGIDFGLRLVAEICGEDIAKRTQLELEYDPMPPFDGGGHPRSAEPAIVEAVRAKYAARIEARRSQLAR